MYYFLQALANLGLVYFVYLLSVCTHYATREQIFIANSKVI
jgi:hypothetical protein